LEFFATNAKIVIQAFKMSEIPSISKQIKNITSNFPLTVEEIPVAIKYYKRIFSSPNFIKS